jgi:threonine aldolase
MTDSPPVDLRSDTVTRPTQAMRRAMAQAEVGDDVFGEDPTVSRLEELAASRIGAEAGLFVPTGTMGNQVALHVHASPGSEVVLDARCHILNYEKAAMAVLSGLLPRPVPTPDGKMTPAQVEALIAEGDVVHTPTGLVALENTHNMAGGAVMPIEQARAIQDVSRRHGIPVHLDGARIFNAAAALGVSADQVAAGFDSVMFCLSKGLGAPVGSMLCGSKPFIQEARKTRKMFGGGMRQVGVLAAAGIVALEEMTRRVGEDHDTARRISDGLAQIEGIALSVVPATNILMFRVSPSWFHSAPQGAGTAEAFVGRLRQRGIWALPVGPDRVRMVTHFDLPPDAVERTLGAVAETR